MGTKYWNYVDALAYALALNERDSLKMEADSSVWHRGVFQLRDKHPEILSQIIFDEKPGRPPYSPQVEHFLHVQAQARLMSGANPAYKVLEMSATQKSAIIRLNEDRLSDFKDELKEMGEQLLAAVQHEE